MAQAVSVSGLDKHFVHLGARQPIFAQLDLAIEPHAFVAILGASGCGKSTLLRLIAGLDAPNAGQITIGDRRVTAHDERCAVVFQEPRLFPWKRVDANIAVGARRLAGRPDPAPWLAQVGLQEFAKRWPHQLSGGQAQRVALARALIGRPQVMLLDEPFAALDALTRIHMQDLLSSVCAEHRPTVVMVTHDVDEALRLADRVVVLGGQPARIQLDLAVPGQRPRDAAPLGDLRKRLLRQLGVGACTGPAPAVAGVGVSV